MRLYGLDKQNVNVSTENATVHVYIPENERDIPKDAEFQAIEQENKND